MSQRHPSTDLQFSPQPRCELPLRATAVRTCAGGASSAGPDRSRSYRRDRDLPTLIPLWPAEIADNSISGHAALIRKLWRALRHERRRGVSGHWAYDLARHRALVTATRAEEEALRRRCWART